MLQQIKQRYGVVGNSPQLNRALDVCLQVAPTDLSVLIIGESGVGKEVLPRIIHDNSPRRRERYFAINCGSIPEGTIDSELFGHEKGAFTSAIGESDGYFGIANKGTLFLDEVGELPLATQARLLRVLETGEYIRVGGQEVRRTDVRIVAATNVNLRRAISEGRFREDLYYRLNTIPVMMPPLRDRGTDILMLFRLFDMNMQQKYNLPRLSLTKEAEQLLLKYKWPGNVRQLKNVTEQLSVLSQDRTITHDMLLQFIPDDEDTTAIVTTSTHRNHGDSSYEAEREVIFKTLFELQNSIHELQQIVSTLTSDGTVPPRRPLALPPSPAALPPRVAGQTPSFTDDDNYIEEIQDSPRKDTGTQEKTDTESTLNVRANELDTIRQALQKHNGNRRRAAQELGISERTLFRRLKEL